MTTPNLTEGRALMADAKTTSRHLLILPGNPAEDAYQKADKAMVAWLRNNADAILSLAEEAAAMRPVVEAADMLTLRGDEQPGYWMSVTSASFNDLTMAQVNLAAYRARKEGHHGA